MIKIYYSPSCSSCRKVKKWFDEQKIPYEAKDIFSRPLTSDDIKEIIQTRSKIVSENNIDFDDMKVSELISFIQKNPSVLKRPIIVDDHRIQVGYNEEEIRTFIPRARRMAETFCTKENCPEWGNCLTSKDIEGKVHIKK